MVDPVWSKNSTEVQLPALTRLADYTRHALLLRSGPQFSSIEHKRAPPKQYLLMDRDDKFSAAFRSLLEQSGIEPVRLPPHSPNLNAHLERFMRGIGEECLGRMIFFGESALRNAVSEFLAHYHGERNHQGLDNQLIDPGVEVGAIAGRIECRERLGGLLWYYHRAA